MPLVKLNSRNVRMSIRVSSSLAPDQTRHFVRPDLGPNCLQKLSANETSRRRVNQRAYNTSLYMLFFLANLINHCYYLYGFVVGLPFFLCLYLMLSPLVLEL